MSSITRADAEQMTIEAFRDGEHPGQVEREEIARAFIKRFESRKPTITDCRRQVAQWQARAGIKPPPAPDDLRKVRCVDCVHCPDRITRCEIGGKQVAGNLYWRSCDAYVWLGESAAAKAPDLPSEPAAPIPEPDPAPDDTKPWMRIPEPVEPPAPPTLADLKKRLADDGLSRWVSILRDTEAGRELRLVRGAPDDAKWWIYAIIGGLREHEPLHEHPVNGRLNHTPTGNDGDERTAA